MIDGRTYAFIGLERTGGIMVYDITDPTDAQFVQYINTRDFSQEPGPNSGGDLAPEGLAFIAAEDSPTGQAMLAVGFEVSGTTRLFAINVVEVDSTVQTGSQGANTIIGDTASDTINGAAGNDVLDGWSGNDLIDGGTGNDIVRGDTGNDTLWGGKATDRLYGGDGNDGLDGGAGNDTLWGGKGNDLIDGGAGHDVIDLGAGRDSYVDDAGNDTITVGDGARDALFYAENSAGTDTVLGWDDGQDVIDLSDLYGEGSGPANFGAFQVGGGAITDLRASTAQSGVVQVVMETGGATVLIHVDGGETITQADFLFH